jgi:7,8-dihydro-6-hydroxymethylpterin dimethyltransferase
MSGLNRISPNASFTPKWSDKPLQKSWQKEKPPLGWPRTTDSLCPKCVPEIRKQILDGKLPHEVLLNEKVGEIKAQIIERDGKILMVKDCPKHGHFEDVMSIDRQVLQAPGRELPRARHARARQGRQELHHHGTSTVTHGRGSVLTDRPDQPLQHDVRSVLYGCEPGWLRARADVGRDQDHAGQRHHHQAEAADERAVQRRRADAVAVLPGCRGLLRKVGYNSVQAASNGIEFAKSKELCRAAAEAGLRYVYLQFDGIGNAANSHRKVGNLFDVKLQAINNLHEAGVEIVPVTTIVNGINNEQVGRIIEFALDNPKKISFLSFQPVSFTGRDEALPTSAGWRSATR